jgi:hypothetical protein
MSAWQHEIYRAYSGTIDMPNSFLFALNHMTIFGINREDIVAPTLNLTVRATLESTARRPHICRQPDCANLDRVKKHTGTSRSQELGRLKKDCT